MAIFCYNEYGPSFGISDIFICDKCNQNDCGVSSFGSYGCNDSSFFVGGFSLSGTLPFKVLDYEVYCIDYENQESINKLCKHPDIILQYIETKDILEESLKQFNDDTELLNDLSLINCDDNNILLKISQYYLKNPSKLLVNTTIVNDSYDTYLREWLRKNCKCRLLYRASEHNFSSESFHDHCDDKGPTLVIIKSIEGWIFGGYTTKSWSGSMYNYIFFHFL